MDIITKGNIVASDSSRSIDYISKLTTRIAKFMGPTWGPPGSCRPQMGPMLAPWTLLSGHLSTQAVSFWTSYLMTACPTGPELAPNIRPIPVEEWGNENVRS